MQDYWFKPYKGTVISYNTLRRLVGAIGVALPVVLGGVGYLRYGSVAPSISAYYHVEDLRDWFVGSLWAFGVFLMAYRLGRLDNVLATIAGVLAIAVSLFPTAPEGTPTGERSLTGTVHLVCAAAFFVLLAVLSYLFSKPRGDYDPAPWRKVAHKFCAMAIALSVIVCAILIATTGKDVRPDTSLVFWFETIGVAAFGVSWFMTGYPVIPKFVKNVVPVQIGPEPEPPGPVGKMA